VIHRVAGEQRNVCCGELTVRRGRSAQLPTMTKRATALES
jgi:hypothetical protein